jgi:hypothetical protein
MDMNTESQIEQELIYKLMELGFPSTSLKSQYKTPYGKFIDLVAFEYDKPKIVFEVRSKTRLQPDLSLENEGFRFHPVVRQAQLLAQEISAPYFAVYDGDNLLWFEVDKRDGGPHLIDKPILPYVSVVTGTEESKNQILKVFFELADLCNEYLDFRETLERVGITILARLMSEAGNHELESLLTSENSTLGSFDGGFSDLDNHTYSADNDFYIRAFWILDRIRLSEIPADNFVEAADNFIEFFVNKAPYLGFKLPSWISQLIVALMQIDPESSALDIYSNFGDGVVAINRFSRKATVTSVTSFGASYIWDKIKRNVVGLKLGDVFYVPRLHHEDQRDHLRQIIEPQDYIFLSPPFGGKSPSDRATRFRRNEEIFLELSLHLAKPGGRVVAIVPENLLFSNSSEAIRSYILELAWIRAVISLEQFLPSSSVKVSIIVLDRKSASSLGSNIFMSRITSKDVASLSKLGQPAKGSGGISQMLDLYFAHLKNETIKNQSVAWYTPQESLDSKTWAVDYYDPDVRRATTTEYPLLSLEELVTLRKGSSLSLDKNGDLPVIGPGSLRRFVIDATKLDKTIEAKLGPKPVVSQVNDVLMHAVGSYRGQTALVEPGFENCFISRNIIVLRNISSRVLPAYLTLALNSKFVRQQLESRATGSVIAHLSIRKLYDLKIPVPELATQRKLIDQFNETHQKLLEIEQQALVVNSALKEQEGNLQTMLDNLHMGGGENA